MDAPIRIAFWFLSLVPVTALGAVPEKNGAFRCQPMGEAPQLEVALSSGKRLVVCGTAEEVPGLSAPTKQLSEFQVMLVAGKKLEKRYMDVGALDEYRVSPLPQQGLHLEELWYYHGALRPAFERDLICHERSCNFTESHCVVTNHRHENPAQRGIRSPIEKLFSQAISGDAKARARFQKSSPPVSLDGEESENWKLYSSYLKRLDEAKCLN